MTIAISFIPEQFWDTQLRELSAKIQYNLIIVGLEYNELNLIKGGALVYAKLPLKKWYHTTKVLWVPEPIEPSLENKLKKRLKKK